MVRRLAVTFLRHGMTKWNEESRYLGWSDLPLSEAGKEKVRLLSIPRIKPNLIITSSLLRCIETANLLYENIPMQIDENLKEIHFGDWEGRTYEQLKDVPSYKHWLEHPNEFAPEHGETLPFFQQRVLRAWQDLIEEQNEAEATELVFIVHGGVIRYLLTELTKNLHSFWEWDVRFHQAFRLLLEVSQKGEIACISLQVVPLMGSLPGYTHIIN